MLSLFGLLPSGLLKLRKLDGWHEIERAKNAFAEYGLILERSQCSALTTSAAEPLLWCALDRRALA